MPPILAAHLDLELSLESFNRLIGEHYVAAKRDYDAAKAVYVEAGGSVLPDEHPAVVAYDVAEATLVKWARIGTECGRIVVPSLRDLGLSAVGKVSA